VIPLSICKQVEMHTDGNFELNFPVTFLHQWIKQGDSGKFYRNSSFPYRGQNHKFTNLHLYDFALQYSSPSCELRNGYDGCLFGKVPFLILTVV
jgi:hypothetical protein